MWGTVLYLGEKRSLYRFLLIYIGSSFLLLGVGLSLFFSYEKHRLIDHQYSILKAQSKTIIPELRALHISQETDLIYPQYKEFKSAIYDIEGDYLFGDLPPEILLFENEQWQKNDMLFYLQSVSPYYMGAAYILIQKPIDLESVYALKVRFIVFFVISMFFVTLISFWLGKLFLAPMRDSIMLLDNFVKDATHEINTPVTTILANAELLKSFHPELQSSRELSRIETSSRRLSRIYDDLAYVGLNHQRSRRVERVNISTFIKERIDYFQIFADAKHIEFTNSIEDDISLDIDKEDLTRIIDNLLGNAFKYSRANGSVEVVLDKNNLSIEDSGVGMDEDSKQKVLHRFVRANKSEGGFGLGLSIVSDIAKYYDFELEIGSKPNQGTKVSILWKK